MANTVTVVGTGKAGFADRMRTSPATYTNSPKVLCQGAYTTGTRTGLVTDSALLFERETRVSGTEAGATSTYTNDNYQVSGTITASASYSCNEAALNDTTGAAPFHTTASGATGTGGSFSVAGAGPSSTMIVQIEDEVINITAGGTTTTWTATRGQGNYSAGAAAFIGGSTTAVSHATGSDIGRSTGSYFTSALVNPSVGVNNLDSITWTWKIQLS